MPLSDTIKTLIRNAWDDGYPCLLATSGREGPNITPKGSMIVFDDAHLAYWERSKRAVLDNLSHDQRVCVMYANFKAQRDGVLESGFLRFFGSVVLHESGPVREAIFSSQFLQELNFFFVSQKHEFCVNYSLDFLSTLASILVITM